MTVSDYKQICLDLLPMQGLMGRRLFVGGPTGVPISLRLQLTITADKHAAVKGYSLHATGCQASRDWCCIVEEG